MRRLHLVLAFGLLVQLLTLSLAQHSTGATLTDQSLSAKNAFVAKTMQPPALSATVAGSSVSLAWTNPDALSGPNASFIVQRAAGNCSAPGTFSPIAGSPFATNIPTMSDTPGAPGTYCYAVQSALYSWRSAAGAAGSTNQRTVTVLSPVTAVYVSSAASGVCGTAATLTAGSGGGSVTLGSGVGQVFAAPKAEALTGVPGGTHVARIEFPATASSGTVNYSVEIGVCGASGFRSLGTQTDRFSLGNNPRTRTLSITVSAATPLGADEYLAMRLVNTGTRQFTVGSSSNGVTRLTAPAGATYR